MSIYDFAVAIAEEFELDRSLISPVTASEMKLAAERPLKTGFIILKAETEFGYRPRPLREALQDLRTRIEQEVPYTS